jgi:hypothetical protein
MEGVMRASLQWLAAMLVAGVLSSAFAQGDRIEPAGTRRSHP